MILLISHLNSTILSGDEEDDGNDYRHDCPPKGSNNGPATSAKN